MVKWIGPHCVVLIGVSVDRVGQWGALASHRFAHTFLAASVLCIYLALAVCGCIGATLHFIHMCVSSRILGCWKAGVIRTGKEKRDEHNASCFALLRHLACCLLPLRASERAIASLSRLNAHTPHTPRSTHSQRRRPQPGRPPIGPLPQECNQACCLDSAKVDPSILSGCLKNGRPMILRHRPFECAPLAQTHTTREMSPG